MYGHGGINEKVKFSETLHGIIQQTAFGEIPLNVVGKVNCSRDKTCLVK